MSVSLIKLTPTGSQGWRAVYQSASARVNGLLVKGSVSAAIDEAFVQLKKDNPNCSVQNMQTEFGIGYTEITFFFKRAKK